MPDRHGALGRLGNDAAGVGDGGAILLRGALDHVGDHQEGLRHPEQDREAPLVEAVAPAGFHPVAGLPRRVGPVVQQEDRFRPQQLHRKQPELVPARKTDAEGGAPQRQQLAGRGDRQAVDGLRTVPAGVQAVRSVRAERPVQVAEQVRRVDAALRRREGLGPGALDGADQVEGGGEPRACQAPEPCLGLVAPRAHEFADDPEILGVGGFARAEELAKGRRAEGVA